MSTNIKTEHSILNLIACMEYNTIPRPAPTPACPTYPEHVQCPGRILPLQFVLNRNLYQSRPQAAGSICAPVRVE